MSRYKRSFLHGRVLYDGEEQAPKRRALSSGSSYSRSPASSTYQDVSCDTRETSDGNDGVSDDLDRMDTLGRSSGPLTHLSITSPVHCELSSITSSVSRDNVTRPEFCFGMVSPSVDALYDSRRPEHCFLDCRRQIRAFRTIQRSQRNFHFARLANSSEFPNQSRRDHHTAAHARRMWSA